VTKVSRGFSRHLLSFTNAAEYDSVNTLHLLGCSEYRVHIRLRISYIDDFTTVPYIENGSVA